MRNLLVTVILFIATDLILPAQIITIIDSEDLKPLADVAILDNTRTNYIYSDRTGKADISAFKGTNEICFHHFTYEWVCLKTDEIKENGYLVRLNRKIFAIEEFVISAKRWEQNKNEVPNRITTISKPVIDLQNPQTAADLIALSGEVFVQKSQLGGGSPMIRGFATNRVLIVVDGVRMNNAIYREGNIQNVISLDPSSLESSEVIFGPGAIVYGSDAIGGVMDFHTKKALYSTTEKPLLRVDALTRFSTADKERTFHLDIIAGTRNISLISSITLSDYDDLKMGSGGDPSYLRREFVKREGGRDTIVLNEDPRVQVYSGYKQVNTMNKLRIRLSERSEIVFSNHYSKLSDVPRYDRLIQYRAGRLRYGDWYYGPQKWMMNHLHLSVQKKNALYDGLKATAAIQNYRESRHDRNFGSSEINEQTEKVTALSLNIDFDKDLNENKDLLYYGLEFVHNDISSEAQRRNISTGSITPAGSRYPNGENKYTSASLYVGYKRVLGDKANLITGIRYNNVRLYSTIADNSFYNFPFTTISITNGALTGSAGSVIKVSESSQLSLNLSTGFRAPNLDDAGKVFDSAPGVVVVPNPGLKPEYVYNADLSFKKDFDEVFHAEITVFYSVLKNAMVRHDFLFDGQDSILYLGELSKVEAITNSGMARVYGLHFNLQANISRKIRFRSSLNITEGFEKNRIPLRHAAPVFGSAHLVFHNKKFETDLYTSFNGPKPFEKMAPSEIEKPYLYAVDKNGNPWSPGWVTLNYKASYEIGARLLVNVGIENILDQRYRPYSSGIAAAGRNFIISLRLRI